MSGRSVTISGRIPSLTNGDVTHISYRSGKKNRRVGVPDRGNAALVTIVGGRLAGARNGLLYRRDVRSTWSLEVNPTPSPAGYCSKRSNELRAQQ